MVNGHYIHGLGETEAEKAARKQAGRAARQAAAGTIVSVPGYVAPAPTGGGPTAGTSAAQPAPSPASDSGFSLGGLFSNISPPVMIVGLAVVAILLLKKR